AVIAMGDEGGLHDPGGLMPAPDGDLQLLADAGEVRRYEAQRDRLGKARRKPAGGDRTDLGSLSVQNGCALTRGGALDHKADADAGWLAPELGEYARGAGEISSRAAALGYREVQPRLDGRDRGVEV